LILFENLIPEGLFLFSLFKIKNLEEIQNPEGDSISVATGETRGRNEKGLGETQTSKPTS
jgi:hypothetical protein